MADFLRGDATPAVVLCKYCSIVYIALQLHLIKYALVALNTCTYRARPL